ncbi:MAG: S9 family peptidase, partial [Planctomycetota bacterium]
MTTLAFLLAASLVGSSDKRAFDLPDVYGIAQVNSPAVSADGRTIAFGVRRYDVAGGTSWSELWSIGVDGKNQKQLTAARKLDSDPHFSPDGKSLVFVSNRSGSSQLWTLPLDGGEPRVLTSYAPGVEGPVFSPDGKWIAVTSEVWPDISFDGAAQKE